jgi:hypothetical protein
MVLEPPNDYLMPMKRVGNQFSRQPVSIASGKTAAPNLDSAPISGHPRFSLHKLAFSLSLLLPLTAAAITSNPYTGIVDRNVFSLKPPTPVETAPKEEPKPPVKLTLTGITTILGNKRALLKAAIPAKAPEPAKEESNMLTEGQRDGGVEVISIDEKAGAVTVNNNGIRETLDFVNNGAKMVAAAAPAGTPGVIQPPGMNPTPGNPGAATGVPLPRTIPTRSLRTPQNQGGSENGVGNVANSQFSGNNAAGISGPQPSSEEQTLMIEGQRIHLQEQGKHDEANLFPVTELTPGANPEADPSPF